MSRFLHVADLHLADDEYDYSVGVLKEIVGAAAALHVDAVLVAGHLGDGASLCAETFRKATCPWIWVPGAGESTCKIDNVSVLADEPWSKTTIGDTEIIGLPGRDSFTSYRAWQIPDGTARHRVAVVHASVAGMPSQANDASGGVVDPDLFSTWSVDYAALGSGHNICSPAEHNITVMADPGSARLTTRSSSSPCGAFLVDLNGTVQVHWVPLGRAGHRRDIFIMVPPDGRLPALETSSWQPEDIVQLRLSGLLTSTTPAAVIAAAKARWQPHARKLHVDGQRLATITDAKLAKLAARLATGATTNAERAARNQCLSLLLAAG